MRIPKLILQLFKAQIRGRKPIFQTVITCHILFNTRKLKDPFCVVSQILMLKRDTLKLSTLQRIVDRRRPTGQKEIGQRDLVSKQEWLVPQKLAQLSKFGN